jgi:hypothetical protein
MSVRRIGVSALATVLAVGTATRSADALTIAQITRHGYVLVDEPDSVAPYDGVAGAASALGFAQFIADVTMTLDAAHAPRPDYIAVMQALPERSVVAFYLRIRNQTRGVGDRAPTGGNSEIYDLNPQFGTAFPIDGALFLNQPGFYTTGGLSDYGTQIICPQEFGHRFLAQIRVPPIPLAQIPDSGMPDASSTDASDLDTETTDADPDAAEDLDATADDAEMDAIAPDDAPATNPPQPIPTDSLLGRDRAHWSYFMNSGLSPVEGNAWDEIMPGVFRTISGTPIRFSHLDLYLMGLLPASAVEPFYVIAEPDVMGQLDNNGQPINRASPPEGFGFSINPVTIRGRRVDYTIDDVIRANGARVPAYQDPDAGMGDEDGGAMPSVREMRVAWILLTTQDAIDSRTASQFDRAIEACSGGYETAASGLAHITPVVLPMPVDAGTDSGVPADAHADASGDSFVAPPVSAGGGCACRVERFATTRGDARGSWLAFAAAAGVIAFATRRRRRVGQAA